MVAQAAYSPDGNQIALAVDYRKLLDRKSGADCTAVSMQDIKAVIKVSYSPCGRWLVTGHTGGVLKFWDLQSGVELYIPDGHSVYIHLRCHFCARWVKAGLRELRPHDSFLGRVEHCAWASSNGDLAYLC